MSAEDDNNDSSTIPKWVIYAGVGVASYVAYKTLFKESKFVHEHKYKKVKSEGYTADYPSGGKYYAVNPWDEIKIRRSKRGPAARKPETVFTVFEKCVNNHPNSVYWKKEYLKKGSDTEYEWRSWTRKEVYDLTKQAARSFIACGLKQWESVSIIGFNSPQWLLADLGAIYAGGIVAGIYTTNKEKACHYIASHSKSSIAVVENKKQLTKFLNIRSKLENLKFIIIWDIDENDEILSSSNDDNNKYAKVIHWNEFMKLGNNKNNKNELNDEMNKRISSISAGQCCTLIYTSGTTGPPKGVMISHDNVTWQARSVIDHIESIKKDGSAHSSISYLPLSHVAAQMIDIYAPMCFTAHYIQCKSFIMHFARPTALKGTLGLTLKEARPTIFFGVPRVWEKIEEKIVETARKNPMSAPKKMLIDWLKSINLKANYNKQIGGGMDIPFGYNLAQKMLTSTVKKKVGLDRLQIALTGAAPTNLSTLEFWASLGVNIVEVYGMSESTGVHTVSLPYYNKIGTVGVPLAGLTTQLQNEQSDERRDKPGHGEICMRGRNVMMGYMYNEDKTKQTIDEDGYLHSGDIGYIDDTTNILQITGRIKELIITKGGENIAPTPIEDYIKRECSAISNIMIIGDKRKYLTSIITLKVKQSSNGSFTNNLTQFAIDTVGDKSCITVDDARKSQKWKNYIETAIKKYNNDREYCVSNAQKVQYFRIIDADFSIETGELTSTMKLKRSVVLKRDEIQKKVEEMYNIKRKK